MNRRAFVRCLPAVVAAGLAMPTVASTAPSRSAQPRRKRGRDHWTLYTPTGGKRLDRHLSEVLRIALREPGRLEIRWDSDR